MRSQLGREGPFPFPAQVAPPSPATDARTMVRERAGIGVVGLIRDVRGVLLDAFVTCKDAMQALLES